MMQNKKKSKNGVVELPPHHPSNPHKDGYDFDLLEEKDPSLSKYVITKQNGLKTINFSDDLSVRALNSALIKAHYEISDWNIPRNNLVPPVPGRADYVLYLADLLSECNEGVIPTDKVKGVDIGTGASLIYPIIGRKLFQWSFVASEQSQASIQHGLSILKANDLGPSAIKLVHQKAIKQYFKGVIREGERYDFTMCNPPFYSSEAEAEKANIQKWQKLHRDKPVLPKRNFSGQDAELWVPGGELLFVKFMIKESLNHKDQVLWFSALVSQKDHIFDLKKQLKKVGVADFREIKMMQGQKRTRFLAWTFQDEQARKDWAAKNWK